VNQGVYPNSSSFHCFHLGLIIEFIKELGGASHFMVYLFHNPTFLWYIILMCLKTFDRVICLLIYVKPYLKFNFLKVDSWKITPKSKLSHVLYQLPPLVATHLFEHKYQCLNTNKSSYSTKKWVSSFALNVDMCNYKNQNSNKNIKNQQTLKSTTFHIPSMCFENLKVQNHTFKINHKHKK
jgi:hypothetical protein